MTSNSCWSVNTVTHVGFFSRRYPTMEETARTQIQQANWQIVNPTTPANIFHLLRRQVHREFRKPLVVMSPKYLLRHPLAKSALDDIGPGTKFKRLLPEDDEEVLGGPDVTVNPDVRRVIFCTGKVYYELLQVSERCIRNLRSFKRLLVPNLCRAGLTGAQGPGYQRCCACPC